MSNLTNKIKALPDDADDERGGVYVYDIHGSQVDRLPVAALKALVKENEKLKRELTSYQPTTIFVGERVGQKLTLPKVR